MRRRAIALAGIGAVTLGVAALVFAFGKPVPRLDQVETSRSVVDREGRLLRPYPISDGRWRLATTRADVDPRFVAMLVAYEDKRFFAHRGVDPLALARSAWQWATHGRIVSGGSTLTMQVARLLEPRAERGLATKARQIWNALRLETALSKDEILSLYLTLAPYGGNLEGARAASLAYFGKEPKKLDPAQTALLVAIPQAPEARRPDRAVEKARAARDRVLDRVMGQVTLPADEIALAKTMPVREAREAMPVFAPHAADQALASAPSRVTHRLTIDLPLQRELEALARERAAALGPEISVAIVAVDHATGEIRARVGSSDYFDTRRAGQVDMSAAIRSPGSTLKPFIYGLAFEDGLAHPETLIDDRPQHFGGYAPDNFDLTFQGVVTVRRALQMSLNVPAIALLEKVGPNRLSSRLSQAGGALVLPRNEAPNLAMGLGGVGVTLTDLVSLYAGIARGGETLALTERLDTPRNAAPRRLLDPVAAFYVGNVLIGTPPPYNSAGNRIAFKTGTSYGYRDAWSVGFDGARTIGVWVGRADGASVPGLVGRASAAPILFDAFARLGDTLEPLTRAPKGALIAQTARLPRQLQRFQTVSERGGGPRIVFPQDGAQLELAANGARFDPVAIKIDGGAEPFTFIVNGVPVAAEGEGRNRTGKTLFFAPDGPGFARVTVMDAKGLADSVMVRLR